jgi:hypothetical protein
LIPWRYDSNSCSVKPEEKNVQNQLQALINLDKCNSFSTLKRVSITDWINHNFAVGLCRKNEAYAVNSDGGSEAAVCKD